MSTLAAILHKEPPPLREVATDAPRDLEKIIAAGNYIPADLQ